MFPLFWNSGNALLWLTIPLIPIHPCCCFPYNYIRMSSLEINPNYSFSQSKALSPISLFCMALVAQSRWEVVYPAVKEGDDGTQGQGSCPLSPAPYPWAGTTPGQNLIGVFSTFGYSQPRHWIEIQQKLWRIVELVGTKWCDATRGRGELGWRNQRSCKNFIPCLCQSERMSSQQKSRRKQWKNHYLNIIFEGRYWKAKKIPCRFSLSWYLASHSSIFTVF